MTSNSIRSFAGDSNFQSSFSTSNLISRAAIYNWGEGNLKYFNIAEPQFSVLTLRSVEVSTFA